MRFHPKGKVALENQKLLLHRSVEQEVHNMQSVVPFLFLLLASLLKLKNKKLKEKQQ